MMFVTLFTHHTGVVGQIVLLQLVGFMLSAFRVGSLFEGKVCCMGM
jgi:hypothetical protein